MEHRRLSTLLPRLSERVGLRGIRADSLPRTRYFARWIVFGVLVGIVAGLGAIAFFWLLEFFTELFLGRLVHLVPPAPMGEGNRGESPIGHPWLLPLITGLGGLLSGLMVFLLAPEAEGHGTDAAIDAFHHKAGRVRARIVPIKTLASAITIGTGGSAGREGPAAQISAGIGSLLGQALRLDANERRILLATGTGAGIGAIFRAPLGGAVLASEILYTHDMEIEALFPSLIASIVGYSIFGSWAGWNPIFGAQPGLGFSSPPQLVYYALLGLICGFVGIVYAKVFYATARMFRRIPLPDWLKPAFGGVLVGLMGLAVPQVIGTGYGWLQLGMNQETLNISLWLLLLLPFAKIAATSLSIGSGGSGGIFGPGMVIGGLVGIGFWHLAHGNAPAIPANPAPFAIVAMMALFGGIAHAPLAVMLMVAEMTGNLSLLAPAMIAVGLATLVAGDHTIYQSQLPTRADSPAHRYQFSFPLLSTLSVRDAMTRTSLLVGPEMTVAEAERLLAAQTRSGLPVVTHGRQLVGVLTVADVERIDPAKRETTTVDAIMTHDPLTAAPETSLDQALEAIAERHVSWMPVVEGREPRVAGVVSAHDIVAAYRAALRWSVRRMSGITADTVLLESRIEPQSKLAGCALREVRLPQGALFVSIHRNGATILPRGDTVLMPGDVVTVLVSHESEPAVREYLSGSPGGDPAATQEPGEP